MCMDTILNTHLKTIIDDRRFHFTYMRLKCVGWCEWFCICTNVYTRIRRSRNAHTHTYIGFEKFTRGDLRRNMSVSAQFIRLVTRTSTTKFVHTQLIGIDERARSHSATCERVNGTNVTNYLWIAL